MTTVRQLVTAAYRRARVTDRRRALNEQEAAIGLSLLQGMFHQWISEGVFGRMTDVGLEGDVTASENTRIIIRTAASVTITLPTDVEDSAYIAPDGYSTNRPPRDGAVIAVSDLQSAFSETYIHDSANGGWVLIEGLTLDSTVPLTPRYRDGLEAGLAVRIADENGQDPSNTLRALAATGKAAIGGRGDSTIDTVKVEFF